MRHKLEVGFAFLLVLALFAGAVLLQGPLPVVKADGVQNYNGFTTLDAGTAHTVDWNGTAFSVEGFGSVVVQVGQTLTGTTDSVIYSVYGSIQPVACSSVTSWYPMVELNTPTSTTYPITQTWTQTGTTVRGYTWDTEGVRCMRISGNLTTGRTVTTVMYIAPVDLYD